MTLLQLLLSQHFAEEIGFTQAIRAAVRVPTDPELIRLFQKLAPNHDWVAQQTAPRPYETPRWLGYWTCRSVCWASDGVIKLVVPQMAPLLEVHRLIRKAHYSYGGLLPFVELVRTEPSHMLLHDQETRQLYVASFEYAEAVLVKQARGFADGKQK